MSARRPRFEIVRTAAGWTARYRASNGSIVMSSGSQVYSRRRGAERACLVIARAFWANAVWAGSEIRVDQYMTIGVEVRELDERA